MTRRKAAPSAVVVLAGLLVLLAPTPASAHVRLTGSSPEQGAHLSALPREVVLEFSEEVSAPAYVVVTAPDGSRLTDGDPVVTGATVRQPVVRSAVAGEVTLAFRVVSADGHVLADQLAFTVGEVVASPAEGAAAEPATDDASPPEVAAAAPRPGMSRGVAVGVPAGLLLAAAGLWWLSTRVEPEPARPGGPRLRTRRRAAGRAAES